MEFRCVYFLPVSLFVTLSFCFKNITLCNNIGTLKDRHFIFDMHTLLIKRFLAIDSRVYGIMTFTMTFIQTIAFCPRLSRKRGTFKLICPSVPLSVCLSVTKSLTWLISSEILMIWYWYLACMILVTSPFNWHHAVTLTLIFDLLKGQSSCRAGDHSSPNLLVWTLFPREKISWTWRNI